MVPSDPRGGARVHDFHPSISASGLFWTIPIAPDRCHVAPDGRTISVDVANVPIVDQPNFPDRAPTTRGTLLRLRVTWTATAEPEQFDNLPKQCRFDGSHAEARIEFAVSVPALDFTFASDPIETSSARFAIMGRETNGRFHEKTMPDLVGKTESIARALLGNISVTNVSSTVEGHEALGDASKHNLMTAVVTATEPAAGATVPADFHVLLHVRE